MSQRLSIYSLLNYNVESIEKQVGRDRRGEVQCTARSRKVGNRKGEKDKGENHTKNKTDHRRSSSAREERRTDGIDGHKGIAATASRRERAGD
jgi:hypothetical protein